VVSPDLWKRLQSEFEEAWDNIDSVDYDGIEGNWWRGFASGIEKAQSMSEPAATSLDRELREAIEEVLSRGHTAAYDLRNDIQAVLSSPTSVDTTIKEKT